jgi:hypothetical protein
MTPDEWITKAQAAAILQVDERTIERRARAGRINAKARPGFPTLYLAADVEMLTQTGSHEVRTGLLTADPTGNGNGHGAVASLRRPAPLTEAWFVDVLQALRGALTHAPIGPTGPTTGPTGPTTLFVTIAEAAALSGLSQASLRRRCQSGWCGAIKDGAWKIRRKDLEAL